MLPRRGTVSLVNKTRNTVPSTTIRRIVLPNHLKIEDEIFFATSKAILRKAKIFFYLQIGLTVLCWTSLIAAFSMKFITGYSNLVVPLALVGGVLGFCGWGVGKLANPYYSNADKVKKNLKYIVDAIDEKNTDVELTKIPLTIGFANLSGADLNAIASEDAELLSPLFARSRVVENHQIPSAEILFVYAHLNEDGTINGANACGIRQIVQLTNAAIIILASPNSPSSIQKAVTLPGPKSANIVLTLDRNGSGFGRFFLELFEKMRSGTDMLSAWYPNANFPYAPETILLAEGGKIAFPH